MKKNLTNLTLGANANKNWSTGYFNNFKEWLFWARYFETEEVKEAQKWKMPKQVEWTFYLTSKIAYIDTELGRKISEMFDEMDEFRKAMYEKD